MNSIKRLVLIAWLLFLVSWILFFINIQSLQKFSYDEAHYIPAAREILALRHYQNVEHPPLGKFLITLGMAIAGDNPIGWRLMSSVFGAITLVGMYVLAYFIFNSVQTALWVAIVTFCNQLLYVQARIAMLDTFMFAFMIWGLVFFYRSWSREEGNVQYLPFKIGFMNLSGAFLGLSIACKWVGIIPLVYCMGMNVLRIVNEIYRRLQDSAKNNVYGFADFIKIALSYIFIPALVYFLCFVPILWIESKYRLPDLFRMQIEMWNLQQRVVDRHNYMSYWMSWPLMIRPIWYAFERLGSFGEWIRGVFMIGNPFIMWSGVPAVIYCLWKGISERSQIGWFISTLYFALYFCWAVIPRKISFYYYYYPAGMILSLALAFTFVQIEKSKKEPWLKWFYAAFSLGVFIYFLPILSGMRIPIELLHRWLWFRSWV